MVGVLVCVRPQLTTADLRNTPCVAELASLKLKHRQELTITRTFTFIETSTTAKLAFAPSTAGKNIRYLFKIEVSVGGNPVGLPELVKTHHHLLRRPLRETPHLAKLDNKPKSRQHSTP